MRRTPSRSPRPMSSARRWPLSRPRIAGTSTTTHPPTRRPMPDDRPYQGRPSSDRPQFAGPRQNFFGTPTGLSADTRPPFRPAPRVEVPAAPMIHSLKLRDGDREIEVSGSAAFVRQVLDDLPAMWARLHGEGSSRPGRIDLPAPRQHEQPVAHEAVAAQAVAEEPVIAPVREPATNGKHAVTALRPTASVRPNGARLTTRCSRCSRARPGRSRLRQSASASVARSRRSRSGGFSSATLPRFPSPTTGRPPTASASSSAPTPARRGVMRRLQASGPNA